MCKDFLLFLDSFSRLGKRAVGLERIRALLKALGDPQDSLAFIHVTGTNGKGSICEMLSEVFIRSGYKTGLFTSPYIIEYNDRIRINGKNISDKALSGLLPKVREAAESTGFMADFSQFEITQAAAFCYFAMEKCDIVILEAGLGGLLDSTNVIDKNICSVIGSVSYDHMAVLGNTLEEIAAQKAGIIKEGCPCILSSGNDERVISVFERTAKENGAELIIPDMGAARRLGKGLDNSFYFDGILAYEGEYRPKMTGEHQIRNALSVIYACDIADREYDIGINALREGIAGAFIPGRAQIISNSPLTILDGGHNPDAAKALASVLAVEGGEFTALIGMSADKSISEYVKIISPYIKEFICTDDFSERALDKNELAKLIADCGGKASTAESLSSGLEIIGQSEKGLICGSLFLAAEVVK
ncbi:MAG: bifunctional folylpolyglutamate synthase/dihydrofolate synthase [Ruminococcus sp.]|nr:bifunctional folylpolyglutamate synthase/dihydrofolate synthase [Ruminococcus sp.]